MEIVFGVNESYIIYEVDGIQKSVSIYILVTHIPHGVAIGVELCRIVYSRAVILMVYYPVFVIVQIKRTTDSLIESVQIAY